MSPEPGIKIGCCGFSGAQAEYYKVFRLVEIQQTFYEPPGLETAARWRSQAPPDFEFTLKAWQLITHEAGSPTYRRLLTPLDDASQKEVGAFKATDVVWRAWQRTRDFARALRANVIVFQCPASFKPTEPNKANLRRFFQAAQRDGRLLNLDLRFAWEPRGEWRAEEIHDLCAELNLVHIVDPLVHAPTTPIWCYLRLHGVHGYRHRYSDSELWQLAERLAPFQAGYCLFNNLSMREDAQRFMRLLDTRGFPPAL